MVWGIIIFLVLHFFMMKFMMKGHNHGKDVHNHSTESDSNSSKENKHLENYRINQMEGELALLKKQNELLQKKLDKQS